MGNEFYQSQEWRDLRYKTLRRFQFKCQACGRAGKETVLHVDHIKPRSKYPELELEESNLQVLCEDCNLGKADFFQDETACEATSLEKWRRDRIREILSNFDYYINEAGLTPEQAERARAVLCRDLKIQGLKERARRLKRALNSDWSQAALNEILNIKTSDSQNENTEPEPA